MLLKFICTFVITLFPHASNTTLNYQTFTFSIARDSFLLSLLSLSLNTAYIHLSQQPVPWPHTNKPSTNATQPQSKQTHAKSNDPNYYSSQRTGHHSYTPLHPQPKAILPPLATPQSNLESKLKNSTHNKSTLPRRI